MDYGAEAVRMIKDVCGSAVRWEPLEERIAAALRRAHAAGLREGAEAVQEQAARCASVPDMLGYGPDERARVVANGEAAICCSLACELRRLADAAERS